MKRAINSLMSFKLRNYRHITTPQKRIKEGLGQFPDKQDRTLR